MKRIIELPLYALVLASFAKAQTGAPQTPREASAPTPSPTMGFSAQSPFAGGVPSGEVTPGVLDLPLAGAIDRGLRHNLGLAVGQAGTRQAQAVRLRAFAALLPNVGAGASAMVEQINLAALGFSGFPGIPGIIGPFSVVDARATLTQPVLNLPALYGNRAGAAGVRAAQASLEDARDVVTLGVANLYLGAVAQVARIETVQAQFSTAEALYRRAADQKNAGVAAGIDVLRAQVEMQAQRQRVIFYQNEFEKQKLNLARAIGLPVGQQFRLTGRLEFGTPPPLTLEQAIEEARRSRRDFRGAQELVNAAAAAKRAAQAERYPAVSFDANYGAIGRRVNQAHGTFTAAGSVRIPVFDGGRIRADVEQADASLEQRRAELADLGAALEYQVRAAMLDLAAARQQSEVAHDAVDLAAQQMTQAQDRFAAGVANNIEVVQAQEAVATANENYIGSLYAYNLAKAALARSVGGAQGRTKEWLGAQ